MSAQMMSKTEIRTRYRDLDPKQNRIKLLAELNGCSEERIAKILQTKPKAKKKYRPRINPEIFRESYNLGLTDSEIAAKFGRDKTSVYQWRKKNGLPAHRKPGGKRV